MSRRGGGQIEGSKTSKSKQRHMEEESKEWELGDVGLYGLAVMGQNFALNMASKGFKVRLRLVCSRCCCLCCCCSPAWVAAAKGAL